MKNMIATIDTVFVKVPVFPNKFVGLLGRSIVRNQNYIALFASAFAFSTASSSTIFLNTAIAILTLEMIF